MKYIDKILHFLLCAITFIVLAKWVFPFPVALFIVTTMAFAKEFYDYKSYGHFCWYDILADVLGLVVGILCSVYVTGVLAWGTWYYYNYPN